MKQLEEWLNSMLSKENQDSDSDLQKKFMNIQLIYTACLKELIRQVSLQCSDRGTLMQRIWNEYLDTVEKAIFFERKRATDIEKLQIQEITKIHSVYETEIGNITKKYNEIVEKFEKNQKDLEQLQKEKVYVIKINISLERKYIETLNILNDIRKDYDKLLNENFNLKLVSDGNPILSSTLRINKVPTNKLDASPTFRDRQTSKNLANAPIVGSSVMSHLIEYKEKENRFIFEKQESIEIINEKKQIVLHTSPLPLNNLKQSPTIIQNSEKPEENKKIEILKNTDLEIEKISDEDCLNSYILEEKSTDTNDLLITKEQEVITDNNGIRKSSSNPFNFDYQREPDSQKNTDFSLIKENCFLLDDLIESLNIDQKEKEEIFSIISQIKTISKTLISKNNKLNFIENEVLCLKEENTKLKIEINELIIERDQLRELDQGRQKNIIDVLSDYSKIKRENKIFKKDMKKFQNSLDNSKFYIFFTI